MKKLSILFAAIILAIAALISGCGSNAGDEFIGTWEHKTDKKIQTAYLTIEKKGDNTFVVSYFVINSKGILVNSSNSLAELKGKILVTPEGRIIEINSDVLTYHDKHIPFKKLDNKILNLNELSSLLE